MTKTRLFKKKYAHELIKVAKGDLEAAVALANAKVSRQENIFFHIQQAIEKSLKAYICWLEKPVPLVHEISILLDRLPANSPLPHTNDLADLSQFASIRRYEEGTAEFTQEEISGGLFVAKEVLEWIEQQLALNVADQSN